MHVLANGSGARSKQKFIFKNFYEELRVKLGIMKYTRIIFFALIFHLHVFFFGDCANASIFLYAKPIDLTPRAAKIFFSQNNL